VSDDLGEGLLGALEAAGDFKGRGARFWAWPCLWCGGAEMALWGVLRGLGGDFDRRVRLRGVAIAFR